MNLELTAPTRLGARHDDYALWYRTYIRSRLGLLGPNLRNILKTVPGGGQTDYELFVKFLESIADQLTREPQLALAQIVENLCASSIITPDQVGRSDVPQLVFICIGLLTFLYYPRFDPSMGMLELHSTAHSALGEGRSMSCHVTDNSLNNPLVGVVRNFLSVENPLSAKAVSKASGNQVAPPTTLNSSNITYYTLKTLAGVNVELTESVTDHLVLDVRQNSLKIFRFPSFCVLGSTSFNWQSSTKPYLTQYI